MTPRLPPGFDALERYALQWDLESSNERRMQRLKLPMNELREFYDAVLPHAERALSYIDRFPIGSLPEDAQHLLRVVLGLAHAAVSVEVHQQHRGHNAPKSDALQITSDLWPQ